MSTLPVGTVTFLFTDIEASTRLWEQHPEAMKGALAEHDAILRRAVEANGGQIIKTTGDGIHAVFATAEGGAAAALAAQRALNAQGWESLKPQSVRVRMGLHSGEAELRGGDYYGSAPNRAARLMSVAHELECFAFIAVAQGHSEHAANLIGAAEALRERLSTDMTPIERREYEKVVSSLRAQMDEEVLAKAWTEGRAMTIAQAIQLALEPNQGG